MTEGMKNLVFFVDDICIHNNTWAEHIETLKELLERLRKHGVTIAPEKLHKEVKALLGLCNFYNIFVDKYAELTTPLRKLLSKDKVKLVWTQECESTLNIIKAEFMSDKVPISPDFNFKLEIKTVKGQHNTLADFLSRQIEDKKTNMELTKENNDLRHISQSL
ncbi:uncharacterized protein LOC131930049 [Physella acuta]|uniref:uncharacterized protein LOC131930049 n=1 Tax=Physella acuta TaxID=109671 RepID=UPI0027DBAB1F|nr:uncharacterized protein LOC131930049 [Physella acuta]